MSDTPQHAERITTAEADDVDTLFDQKLRPTSLDDFVGQPHIKEPLHISIQAAQSRQEPIDHVLLYGNPGLGKTTLAGIVAREMNASLNVTAGPALERVGDLAAILSNLGQGDVLFIDEMHRINKTIEEVLYTAMEDYAIDIIVGKGPAAKTLRMPIEPFTLVGATTKLSLLSSPLRDRFGHVYHLQFYSPEDIASIVARSARLLQTDIDADAIPSVAARSRRTPRVANRLLKRLRDYAQVRGDGIITPAVAADACQMLAIDDHGLDAIDRTILHTIAHTFEGGPVGLSTLAAAVAEEMETIEMIYEPYLLQIGMIERTPRGRKVTARGKQHIKRHHT
jgi:holliday junction DNA helicase RuvB